MKGRWRFSFKPFRKIPLWLGYSPTREEANAFWRGFLGGWRQIGGCVVLLLIAGAAVLCAALVLGSVVQR